MEVSPGSGREERGETNTLMTCWSPWTVNLPPVFTQQALSASCVRNRVPKHAGTGGLRSSPSP